KRVRCLRKIADILALKGDFQESVIRYKKVQDVTIEANNLVENVIISLNKARINLYMENYDEIIDDYKYAERFLFENGLENILVDILAERGLLYIFSDKEELFDEVLEKLGEREREGIETARVWISYLNGIKQIHKGEYNDAYGSLISTLQEALEIDKLISVGVLFNLIRIIVEIYKENLNQPFVSEEVNNYLGLISGIVNESNFFYLKGLSYLVNLLWQIISKEGEDHNEIIIQASEYFAKTGIEEFGNFLLILQYNMAEWLGLEGVKIQSVFATPRKFESPQIALMELLEKAV
ncbi:unnamed protein product, partial [marine sediment metagenome]